MYSCSFMVNKKLKQLNNLSANADIQINRSKLLELITNEPSTIDSNMLNVAAQVLLKYPNARELYISVDNAVIDETTQPDASIGFENEQDKIPKIKKVSKKFIMFDIF